MSLCELLFHSFTDIIAFLSNDGGGGGKAEGLANQTDGSVVCSNVMNQCIFCKLLFNSFTNIIAVL